jgi:hypothetical protein
VLLAVGGLTLLCLALLVAFVRLRATSARTTEELTALRQRFDELVAEPAESSVAPALTPAPVEFLITDLGREPEPIPEAVRLDGPTFADIVLKETVVKTASLAHGVRRALAPATRSRIRFEMKQEVRRSRKQRRRDLKAAQRHLRREAS